jgi:hypothetical protein
LSEWAKVDEHEHFFIRGELRCLPVQYPERRMERTKNTDKEVNRLLYDFYQWRVEASNSKKHLELWQAVIQHQKANRERFYFKRSRFFTKTDSESNEEHWINIDEYENREAYEKMWKAIENQPDLPYSNDQEKASQLRKEKRSLTVDYASRGLFTERPELAID